MFDKNYINPYIDVVKIKEHNHDPEDNIIENSAFINEAKQAIWADSTIPVKRQYDEKVVAEHGNPQQGGSDFKQYVPVFISIAFTDDKNQVQLVPAIPHDIKNAITPKMIEKDTWRGHIFFFHQEKDWGIAIFGTQDNIREISKCQQVTPEPYEQVFIIFGRKHGRVIDFFYIRTMTGELQYLELGTITETYPNVSKFTRILHSKQHLNHMNKSLSSLAGNMAGSYISSTSGQ